MIKREDDLYARTTLPTDYDDLGNVSFEQAKFMPIISTVDSEYFNNIDLRADQDNYFEIVANVLYNDNGNIST